MFYALKNLKFKKGLIIIPERNVWTVVPGAEKNSRRREYFDSYNTGVRS